MLITLELLSECVEGVFAITQHEVHTEVRLKLVTKLSLYHRERKHFGTATRLQKQLTVQFYSSLVCRANEIINNAILTETAARSCRHKCSTLITMAAPDA